MGDFGMAQNVSDYIYYITRGEKIPVRWTVPEVGS